MKVIYALAAVCVGCLQSHAAVFEAIPAYTRGAYTAFAAAGGTGFAFSPRSAIGVTKLGCDSYSLTGEPFVVAVWNTNGQQLASAVVTTNSPFLNHSYYEPIPLLLLNPGQTYYVQAVGIGGYWAGYEIDVTSLPPGSFSIAPDIDYLANAVGTNSAGVFPNTLGNTGRLDLGANFQYSTGPFIRINHLELQTSQAQVHFTVFNGSLSSFTLLQAAQVTGPWTTNLDAVLTTNAPGIAYNFTAPANGPIQFYRVRSP